MLDSKIRGLFKRIEYQIANLKGLFSKNEKQMLDNINEFKKDNEDFKDSQKFILDKHKEDTNNPHKVTKTQIGLAQVDNVKQASIDEFNSHVNNKNNPHSVTKSHIGLSNVDNIKQATKTDFDSHLNNNNNPHSVTKVQIGLGAVDNVKQAPKVDFDNHVADKVIHTYEAEKNKWNNGQLYRLTQNNGKPIYKGVSETTDYNEITDTGLYLIYNNGLNAPEFIDGAFMIVISYGTTLLQTIYDTAGRNSYYRIRKTDSTWTNWTRVLTNKDEITQSEKDKWNNGQLYKLTPNDGKVARLPNGTDIFTLPTGFYMGANLLNVPIEDGSFYYIEVLETAYLQGDVYYKRINVTRSFDNLTWIGTFHAQGFRGWKKTLTVEDVANSTFVDTYDQDNSSVSAAENVATKLVFGATRADDLSEYNRSRAEITLKNSGLYLIRLYITSNNITVGSDNVISCYVNGTEYQRLGNWNPTTSSSTCVLYLTQKFKAGDKVTFYITPKGTNKTISINTAYVTMSQLR